MTTNEKLSLLRGKMEEAGVQAYLIPSSDPHISEYLPDHWRTRAWLSGFDGSAGTLVVTETESGLWTVILSRRSGRWPAARSSSTV